jgi:HPt (histidine-containing phosphotransfer) domain-containing protein
LKVTIENLKKNPKNEDLIKDNYTAYHKLKGNAAIIGLENLRQLCYLFEKSSKKSNVINNNLVNLQSESIEVFSLILKHFRNNVIEDLDPTVLKNFSDRIEIL